MSRFKYPRTCHFPFSEGATDDDKILTSTDHFKGQIVVVTEKMDGENTTIYSDHCHARSIDSKHKPYHSWLLSYISSFQHQIPDNWRICGEYLYAKHSIGYDNLPSYLMVFSIWDETNTCLSWDDTVELCADLGLEHVPVIYKGEYDEELIKKLAKETVEKGGEGIVVRLERGFNYNDFSKSIAKFVRKNHVQTDSTWGSVIEKNNLKK
ncbi:MAG: RNA ligase family protein [Clostridia bacterium]|nr:RNA ligase family protein [Clostridia bacterium]